MLSKEDTKMMQALSVMAMLCLHLFDRTDFTGLYEPLLFLFGRPLVFYFAQLSDFCVMGFAFCSGYAYMKMYVTGNFSYKRRLKALFSLFVNYWVVMLFFNIISILTGNSNDMPGNWVSILLNVTTINTSWDGACWYLFSYAVIVVLSPALLKISEKANGCCVICIAFILYAAGFYTRFKMGTDAWLPVHFGCVTMTLFEYLIGVLCVRYHIFEMINHVIDKINGSSGISVGREC